MQKDGQPEVPTSETVREKKQVDALVLAEALLDYALKPAGPELELKCSRHYLDELLFFKMFTVDYILGFKSANNPIFATVRQHYNEEIEKGCASDNKLYVFRDTVFERFTTYSEACNADNLTPREYKGKPLRFWELGKAFSSLASDTQPWTCDSLEVVLHANMFVGHLRDLAEFLEQYEVTSP